MREGLTQERLKELLHYDPETGVFTWRVDRSNVREGTVAGGVGQRGYVKLSVDGVSYPAHRLAFLYMTAEFPKFVDHRDRVTSNNAWANLRGCTHSQNICNTVSRSYNTSGYKGVAWHKASGKYRARIMENGISYHLGVFACPREAAHAYNCAAIQLHGDFAVLNPI